MAKNVKVRILVNTGTAEVPEYEFVGGQRSASFEESSETIDMTSEDSAGAYEYDYGLYGWTVSCDGVYVLNDAAYEKLKNSMRNKEMVKIQISENGTSVEEGDALVISRSLEGAYDGESTYAMELQGSGSLVEL